MSTKKNRPHARQESAVDPTDVWSRRWLIAGLFVFVPLVALVGAKPIVDSDLWYHMAYGRQMIERGSLVLDHTAFSWTPSDNSVIYCAWLSQLAFYGLHQVGGLTALFGVRYLVFAFVFLIGLGYAHRLRTLEHPLVWLAATLTLLMSTGAVFVKPQLGSYVLMTATVALTAWIRHRGDTAMRWTWALPALMIVWVNTHGGFVVGLAYLAAFGVGELANVYLSPATALSPALRRTLFLGIAASGLATVVTPYGLSYPAQFFTVQLPALDLAAVRDYDSIFAATQRPLRYVEYGAAALVLLVALSAHRLRRGTLEWSLVLTNLAFAGIYVYYVRLTFFWAPLVLVSTVTLLAERPRWAWPVTAGRAKVLGGGLLAATVLAGAQAARAEMTTPVVGSWLGFGNGYWNPEDEAEFIARHFPTERIGNDYNAGGYLIWRLGPATKVFMDARYFPYRSWFQGYRALETADGIDALLEKYPADVWCLDLLLPKTVAWFRVAPDWTLAFYGPSAAVFVRRGTPLPDGRLQRAAGLGDIKNLYQSIVALAFAFDMRDLEGADAIVRGMETRFTSTDERQIVAGARTALDGLQANARGDHGRAVGLLSQVAAAYQGMPAAALADSAGAEAHRLWLAADDANAAQMAQLAVRYAPQSAWARYNAGAMGWWLERSGRGAGPPWRAHLETFLRAPGGNGPGIGAARDASRGMLDGRATARPFILSSR